MSTELATLPDRPAPTLPALLGVDLVGAFLSGRNPRTLKAYAKDLDDFARWLGSPSSSAAVELLLSGTGGQANTVALGYKVALIERKLAAATIARRLAALRSMVKLARTLGRVAWTLEVEGPKSEAYRDTRGPGLDGWRDLLAEARTRLDTPKGLRDLAILRLLHDLALRRGEVVALDVADLDLDGGTVAVIGKGKTEATRYTLTRQTVEALRGWLAARGDSPGALFIRLDRAAVGDPGRLDAGNVARMVGALGRAANLARPVRPHGLRHQGITLALELAKGDVRKVQRFSRHAKLETLIRYDDNLRDDHGSIAQMLSDDG